MIKRGRTGWLLPLFVALLVCAQSGCGLLFGKPDATSTMSKDQIEKSMLEHLHEKYGEYFVSSSISQDMDIFGGTGRWTMWAYRVGDSEELSLFFVKWSSPWLESDIVDGYLLVKMRPLFHDAIDEGLASVLPEFMARYRLFTVGWEDDLNSLPGQVSDEDFLHWARQNITIQVQVATSAEEGITQDEFSAQVAPLVESGNTFGVAKVDLQIDVYRPEGYVKMAGSSLCLGPDVDGGQRTSGGMCTFFSGYQFEQTITLKAQ